MNTLRNAASLLSVTALFLSSALYATCAKAEPQNENIRGVTGAVYLALDAARSVSIQNGATQNAKFYKALMKRLTKVEMMWGQDPARKCVHNSSGVTFAYARLDAQGADQVIVVCPISVQVLNFNQMGYVVLHELAHIQGVKDEAQANLVADQVFKLNQASHPFTFASFSDFLIYRSKLEPELKKLLKEIVEHEKATELLDHLEKSLKESGHWSEKYQGWDSRPYRELFQFNTTTAVRTVARIGKVGLFQRRFTLTAQ